MITGEKVARVKKMLQKGEPQGEIKNDLRKEGYTEEEIASLFYDLSSAKQVTAGSNSKKTRSGQIFNLIGASLFIAGISMLAVKTWLTEFGLPLIISGVISLGLGYFISGNNRSGSSEP